MAGHTRVSSGDNLHTPPTPHILGRARHPAVQLPHRTACAHEQGHLLAQATARTRGVRRDDHVGGCQAAEVFDTGDVSELLQRYSVSDLLRATGLSKRTLYDLRNGATTTPSPETIAALKRGLAFLRHRPQELATACGWHDEDSALRRQS